jgi:DNA-binding MarR family transcriptional regulator
LVRRLRGPSLIGVEKKIYDVLSKKKCKPSELVSITSLSPRSVRHALKKLLDKELIQKTPDLYDLRSYFYYVLDFN